jgi:hypothetical protein
MAYPNLVHESMTPRVTLCENHWEQFFSSGHDPSLEAIRSIDLLLRGNDHFYMQNGLMITRMLSAKIQNSPKSILL